MRKSKVVIPKNENCIIRQFRSCFGYMYPTRIKQSEDTEGNKLEDARDPPTAQLRCMFRWSIFWHITFTLGTLAAVGAGAFFTNIALLCLSYSCYLTLRQPVIIFYMVSLVFAIALSIYDAFNMETLKQGYQRFGLFTCAIFYGLLTFCIF